MGKIQRLSLEELLDSKTAVWDIESGGLDGNFDVMLCATIKPFGKRKKATTYRINDGNSHSWFDATNDLDLCVDVRYELEEYDILIHHYGDRFDLPFLNTRLVGNFCRPLETAEMKMVDTWWTLRHRFKLNSNRLATAIDFFDCKHKKTPLDGPTWIAAKAGQKEALEKVVKHNVADVLALEELAYSMASQIPLRYCYWR